MFGAFGAAIGANSVVFVSQVSESLFAVEALGKFLSSLVVNLQFFMARIRIEAVNFMWTYFISFFS